MNKDNFATLEACQRLIDAGIVLETDARWRFNNHSFEWILFADDSTSIEIAVCYPAPSMAEVWRGLPPQIGDGYLELGKNEIEGATWACYVENINDCHEHDEVYHGLQKNTNPTDALIDLYIWTVGQEGGSR